MIAFLDSSAIIYLVEGKKPFADKVRRQLQTLALADPALRTAVSRLAWLECRTGPMKAGDVETLAIYDEFFSWADLICVEMSADVVDLATAIRARHNLKTPDALQAACCLQVGKDHVFLTGDTGFRRVAGLSTRILG
ncbi:MAG: PIN domain-containing protein [Xanthomonadales bacterium]|nr:PIN domain-containing protein [Xanthomonadales bacterium]